MRNSANSSGIECYYTCLWGTPPVSNPVLTFVLLFESRNNPVSVSVHGPVNVSAYFVLFYQVMLKLMGLSRDSNSSENVSTCGLQIGTPENTEYGIIE